MPQLGAAFPKYLKEPCGEWLGCSFGFSLLLFLGTDFSNVRMEIELRLNCNYEKVWRVLKERLDEPAVRLKSHYSTRLYLWAKHYIVVGQKRVSVGTLRNILGLEDIKDNSGRVVQDAPLELWANVKQRVLDHALKEINKQSDIHLEIEFGRGAFRKVLSLGFRITARKNTRDKGTA